MCSTSIIGINESKTLTKSDERKSNSKQWWNNNNYQCECKKYHICEKDYIWNPSTCVCEYRKYLASIIDDSVITEDEIIAETVLTNFNKKYNL